jgi:hypothetical protein
MALAIWPARQGQQRSRVRIFHALSWAFALSPGARSLARTRLASFCGTGLFFPLVQGLRVRGPLVALTGQGRQPGGGQLVLGAPGPGGLLVVDRAGQRPGDPQQLAGRAFHELQVHPVAVVPEKNGRSAATRSVRMSVPSRTTNGYWMTNASDHGGRQWTFRAGGGGPMSSPA